MKRIFFALTLMAGLLLPLAPRAQAATAVSLNFFYDNLSPYGSWIDVADYGYCFQPNVAVTNPDWRPYSDGYWAYTDVGWTWVSYEDFGWATFHYGNWVRLADYGWVWVPGYEWGPAWVSWRTGGDYVGWAPLPPRRGVVYEGRPITGAVDVTFDIGPLYYNFVDIRFIGEPVLRGHLVEPRRNVTIINRTVNVTNITYNNTTVINHGPDVERLNRYSERPIQHLKLQRETTVNVAGGRRGNLNRVNGNALVVAAPPIERSQQKIAPKQVKAKVAAPNIERGWRGVENRQQIEAEMKKQNPKEIPPPTFQPREAKKGQAAAEPAAGGQPNDAAPAANADDRAAKQAARRAAREEQRERAGANASPSAEQPNDTNARQEKVRPNRERRGDQAQEKQAGQNEMKAEQEKEKSQPDGEAANVEQPADQAKARAERKARRAEREEQSSDATKSEESPKPRRQRDTNRQRSENGSSAGEGREANQNEQSPAPQRERSRRAEQQQQLQQSQPSGDQGEKRAARRAQRQEARAAQEPGQQQRENPDATPKKKKRGENQPEQP